MRVCPKCFSLFADQERCPQDDVPTAHDTEVLVGLNLGPYIVRSMVSEGGMGVVYVGEHPTLGRHVAIKVLRPELSLRDDIVERFIQEARAVNTIGHTNIVNIYDFGRTPFGTFYIVMELLEGRTLRALLDSAGPQPLDRVRFVVEGIGAALSAAHRKGFLHRDVKPENVMVGHRGGMEYVKLLDFGIAKLLTRGNTTASSGTMGTPQYMSPEQLDGAKLDQRSDIFSFGCVIYELLTGQVPFPGGSQAGVRQAQLTRQPPPPSICRRDVSISPRVDEAVLCAIALGADDRHQTMKELLEAFGEGFDATLQERGRPPRQAGQPKISWKVFAISGAFAVLLGAIVALVTLLVVKDSNVEVTATDAGAKAADAGAKAASERPRKPGKQPLQDAVELAKRRITQAVDDRERAGVAVSAIDDVGARELSWALQAALRHRDTKLRERVVSALEALGKPSGDVQAQLLKLANNTANQASIRAAAVLARHGDRAHLQRLRDWHARGQEKTKRRTLCELAYFDPEMRKEAFELWHRARSRLVRRGLFRCLEVPHRAGYGPATKQLERRLSAKSLSVKLRAARILGEKLSTQRLRKSFSVTTPGSQEQARALGLLAQRGDQHSAQNLVDCLGQVSVLATVRAQCAIELGRLKAKGVLGSQRQTQAVRQELLEVLRDENTAQESPDLALKAAVALIVFAKK
ncbi:MAG: hypothetical protein CSB49_03860 [Proteobacteria bacterium]|nr:MAG: hypothetical protein CSB49_03860 [Pseudomonadota bacterium]